MADGYGYHRGHRKTDLYDEKEYPDIKLHNGEVIRTSFLVAVLRLADEIDVGADRSPEILFDMSKLTRQRDIDAFGINVSIRLVEVGRDTITLYIRLKEERYEALIRDLAVKLQETLDYCRDVAANRSDLRITQKTIFVHPCGQSGG